MVDSNERLIGKVISIDLGSIGPSALIVDNIENGRCYLRHLHTFKEIDLPLEYVLKQL